MVKLKEIKKPEYTKGEVELSNLIESWGLGFCLGNAVKYIVRCADKTDEEQSEDLSKAIGYIQKYIDAKNYQRDLELAMIKDEEEIENG